MPERHDMDVPGLRAPFRRTLTLAWAVAAALALPAAAEASPKLEVGLSFPAAMTVGQTASASLRIANASTFEDPSFTLCNSGEGGPCTGSNGILVAPSCGQVLGSGATIACAPAGADPGVLQINQPAVGGAGSVCAGLSFLVTPVD